MDDIFDEDADEMDIAVRDSKRELDAIGKAHYRRGYSDGQESAIQDGFNKGFTNTVHLAYHLARCRGLLSTVLKLSDMKSSAAPSINRQCAANISALLERISQLEQQLQQPQLHQSRQQQSCEKQNQPQEPKMESGAATAAGGALQAWDQLQHEVQLLDTETTGCDSEHCGCHGDGMDGCKKGSSMENIIEAETTHVDTISKDIVAISQECAQLVRYIGLMNS